MDRLRKHNKDIVYNLLYSLMVFSLVYMIAKGAGLKLKIIIQFPIVIFSSLLIKFFLFNPFLIYVILLVGSIIVIIVHRFYQPILFIIGERISYLFNNIFENIAGKENISSDNILFFWVLIIVLISLFTAITIFKLKRIYILLPVYILPFLFYWYNFYDEAYWMMVLFLISFIILMGLNRYEAVKNFIYYNHWIKTILIYSILIVILALILPKNYNYLDWPWLQEKVFTYFPFVEDLRSYDVYSRRGGKATLFDFSSTGYQEGRSRLGGPVNIIEKKIMTVRSDEPTYLRGNVKHIYTGDSWQFHPWNFIRRKFDDRLSGLFLNERKPFFEEKYISIRYDDFATTTIFSPYIPDSIYFNKGNSLLMNYDHVLVFPDGIYKNEGYTIKVQKPYPYGILLARGINNRKDKIENIDIYLQIPENKISKETRDLVKTIVKGKKTDFEKAVAIEKYLRDNYEYSLDVKELPKDAEFISHFLFDEKKGYCTYFSTAMAIMLRLEGIPTRYIEGYLVSEEIEPGLYEVSNKNAHTWVEAFIEPVGWLTFEPTPAFPLQARMEDYQPIEEGEKNLDYNWEDPNRSRVEILGQEITDDSLFIRKEDNNLSNISFEKSSKSRKNTGYMVMGIFILLISIRFLRGLVYYIYEDIKYKKLSNNEKIIYLYRQILRLTELFGYPQNHGETHYEYASRIANKFYYHNKKNLKLITHIFVKSKYSTYLTSNEDVNALEDFKETLNRYLKNYWGLGKYFYRKYIKMDI